MISALLLYSGVCQTADDALTLFGQRRTHNAKGVTIPSQQRFVRYFEALLRHGLATGKCLIGGVSGLGAGASSSAMVGVNAPPTLTLTRLSLSSLPLDDSTSALYFKIFSFVNQELYDSKSVQSLKTVHRSTLEKHHQHHQQHQQHSNSSIVSADKNEQKCIHCTSNSVR